MVRKLLFACFAFSFLQYWTRTMSTQYVHLILLFTAGLVVLAGTERADRLRNLLRGGSLLLVAVLFTEVVSYYSGDRYSLLYGLTLIAVILSARLILLQIGLPEVLRSFYHAGVLITAFLVVVGRRGITGYNAGERFSGNGDAHPNLVAFVLGGYLPVMIWRTLEYKSVRKRRWMAALCVLNVLLIFLSGSRGALLAVSTAAAALALRLGMAGRLKGRFRFQHIHVIVVLVAIPMVLLFLARHGHFTRFEDFLNTALSLNNSQRGLKSGLSGRTAFWLRALHLIHVQDRWLFGFGYRMGDVLVGTIDDGYLQLLFETGLISGLIIFGLLVGVFIRLWRASRVRENSAWNRYYYMLWCMLIIYFVNNISTRYLFSFGNGFSICVLILMSASRGELLGRGSPTQNARTSREWASQPRPALQVRGLVR